MVSSLQLSTSGEDTSKTSTTLPSFGDLIKSLQSPEEQHGLQNPSHPPHSHAHAHRQEPYPTHGHHHHDIPPRSPSTPPDASRSFSQQQGPSPVSHHISHPHIPRGRPRSNTAPSVSNTHLSSPFSHHRHLANTEHCADRVRALKDGDGEWSIFDSVAPSVLPYATRPPSSAQPCFHTPLFLALPFLRDFLPYVRSTLKRRLAPTMRHVPSLPQPHPLSLVPVIHLSLFAPIQWRTTYAEEYTKRLR
ncbi:hypothetical protein I350_07813 [Cryptococcus amylolentus CBS 6273]|uniref:Uncharacterized protein n=1 Tax=Cryptococcus amylolentus CBS 6273 TaxID=1296118 RepID=A0A1E3JBE1_9TREE|nr:hypothetical protein I350_07813 [Cryptococcus amylolentus CBS 6273]